MDGDGLGHLALSFAPDQDDMDGALHVEASAGLFSGYAMSWIGNHLLADFAEGMGTYPLRTEPPVVLHADDISLTARPVGSLGQIGIDVHLMDQQFEGPAEVRLTLLTSYQRLEAFAADVKDLGTGRRGEARIDWEQLA